MSRKMFTKPKIKGAAGIAGLAAAGVVIATLPGFALTLASWDDYEWVSGTQAGEPGVGTLDCTAPGIFETRGGGEFLELDAVLNNVLELGTLTATNNGTVSTAVPAVSSFPTPPADNANRYYDALNVGVLNGAIDAYLPAATDLLNLDTNNPVGALGTYAEAQSTGFSAGSSGLITNSGALVNLAGPPPVDPALTGTLSLDNLLTAIIPSTAPLAGELVGLDLEIGAVGSYASFDACDADWMNDVYGNLIRDYLIAGLDLDVSSPLVSNLTELIQDLIDSLNAFILAPGPLISAQLDAQLALLGLTDVTISGAVTANLTLTALTDLLDDTIADDSGIVSINLASGSVEVDIAALFNGANGLNGLAPNTELLINPTVINNLKTALLDAIDNLIDDVDAATTTVLGTLSVAGSLTVDVDVIGLDLATITVPAAGNATVNILDNALCLLPAVGLVCTILNDLPLATLNVTTLATNVVGGLFDVLTDALALVNVITTPLIELVGEVVGDLFGVNGLASVIINAQNQPQPPVANPIPPGWATPADIASGRYDIAAIEVTVLGLLSPLDVSLTLARSSVGVNCPTAANMAACAGY